MIRDVAIRAFRLEQEKDTHVRVLIRPKLRVKVGDAAAAPAGGPAFIREVNCKLNGNLVLGMEAGPHLNEEGFFEFVVRDAKAGAVIEVTWTDAAGDKGRGELTLT